MKDKDKKFSEVLKEKRFELGYTQEEMAAAIGIKSRMYSYYENGDYDNSKSIKIKKYIIKVTAMKLQVNPTLADSITAKDEISELFDAHKNNPLYIKMLHDLIASKDKIINLLEAELQELREKVKI